RHGKASGGQGGDGSPAVRPDRPGASLAAEHSQAEPFPSLAGGLSGERRRRYLGLDPAVFALARPVRGRLLPWSARGQERGEHRVLDHVAQVNGASSQKNSLPSFAASYNPLCHFVRGEVLMMFTPATEITR